MNLVKKSLFLGCAIMLTTSAFAATSLTSTNDTGKSLTSNPTTVSTTVQADNLANPPIDQISQSLGVTPTEFTNCLNSAKKTTDRSKMIKCLQKSNKNLTKEQYNNVITQFGQANHKPMSKQGQPSIDQAKSSAAAATDQSTTTTKSLNKDSTQSSTHPKTSASNNADDLPIATSQSTSSQ